MRFPRLAAVVALSTFATFGVAQTTTPNPGSTNPGSTTSPGSTIPGGGMNPGSTGNPGGTMNPGGTSNTDGTTPGTSGSPDAGTGNAAPTPRKHRKHHKKSGTEASPSTIGGTAPGAPNTPQR